MGISNPGVSPKGRKTLWGGFDPDIEINAASRDTPTAATKFTPVFPGMIYKAYLVMKFREVYSVLANSIATGGTIRVKKSGGAFTDGITVIAGVWDVAAGSSAPGDALIGNANVSTQVASGTEVEFDLGTTMLATADSLALRDVQFGLDIYYTP